MTNKYFEELKKLLKEVFQLDQADLDFGIYRIMNQKREEIDRFLNHDLLPQVENILEESQSSGQKEVKEELETTIQTIKDAGMNPDDSPKVQELRAKYQQSGDLSALEGEVYSHLYNFFKRYYHEGDVIPKRRYKEGVYAIPYEGEEVKLHWANADQYYIKTSEYFNNYTFTLPSGRKVYFKLIDASTEKDNNKEPNGKERFFVLSESHAIEEQDNEFIIPFEYKVVDRKGQKIQEKLNKETLEKVFNMSGYSDWKQELGQLAPTPKNKNRTVLEKHLTQYTARNKRDYFIHKDLGRFLRRELDFYIKNEIMHLDDLDTDNEMNFSAQLSKIKVVKKIGQKIIKFLAQLEEFQKKLFLKKKFVVESEYCLTLDKVPEKLYPQIIENKKQFNEWIKLFAIDEIEEDTTSVGFSELLTGEFLKDNPYLVIDTMFFDRKFKEELLASFEDVDEEIDGLLINSENFQALNILQEKYKNTIDAVYIDPPYNTVHSEILYKNQFKHSSWLSLISNTVNIIPKFWKDDFSFGIAIDDYEFVNLAGLLDTLFPQYERDIVVINHHPQGAGGRLSRTHEYYVLISKPNSPQYLGAPLENYQEDRSFMRSGTAENNFRYGRWKSFYALLLDPKENKIVDAEEPVPLGEEYPTNNTDDGLIRIYPINSKGEERVWRSSYITGKERAINGELIIS